MNKQTTEMRALTLSVESLRHEIKNNAKEGVVTDLLVGVIKNASAAITSAFNTTIDGIAVKAFKSNYKPNTAYRKITPNNFFDYAEVIVPTCEGFTGQYIPYGELLLEQLDYRARLMERIGHYNSLVGRLINSAEERASWRDDTRVAREDAAMREAMLDEVRPFLSGSVENARSKIGELVSRVQDLHDLDKLTDKIDAKLKAGNIDEIINSVNKVNALIKVLAGDITAKKITDLSTAQIKNLHEGVYELARMTEHYGIIYHRAAVFIRQVQDVQEAATKVV